MNEVFSMWKNMKMVVLAVLCAALYAALLIPFKGFVLIQGITDGFVNANLITRDSRILTTPVILPRPPF